MIIRVKAFPESKKELIKKIKDNKFEIYVKARPWQGEANERILQVLREYFPEAKQIRMLTGGKKQNKSFEIITPDNTLI